MMLFCVAKLRASVLLPVLLCSTMLPAVAAPNSAASQAVSVEVVAADARSERLRVPAQALGATAGLAVQVLLPPGYDPNKPDIYPVLYLNDGQDAAAVHLRDSVDALIADGSVRPFLVVAIDMPPNRMAAYGFSNRRARRNRVAVTRYGPLGTQAHAYSEWLTQTLVPTIDARYRTRAHADARTLLGWSLGAASAMNIGWQYPDVFSRTAAFSPSFWLPAARDNVATAQQTRIAQTMIAEGQYHPGSRWFFAVGDAEETDDRDGDGVIDVLDDTRDLIEGWHADGVREPRMKGLRQLGHSTNLEHARTPTRADASLYVLPGGEHNQASWAKMLPVFLRWAYAVRAPALNATGRTESWHGFFSRHVAARDIDVWLPPSYGQQPDQHYPVLYMHDGQNLFDPALSYTGTDWDIDGAMTRLIARGDIREAIVVGIWNTPQRFAEYMPRAPVTKRTVGSGIFGRPAGRTTDIVSDAYLRFLTEELKPFIDARYRTLPQREHTSIMGSSMGGLISLYAGARHPDVFGGIGAVSTHWPACDGCMINWLRHVLPQAGQHRVYFDHGTATLDAKYAPYQSRMDAVMRDAGYTEGRDWVTLRFEGAEHNEAAWQTRVDLPLRFLLGNRP